MFATVSGFLVNPDVAAERKPRYEFLLGAVGSASLAGRRVVNSAAEELHRPSSRPRWHLKGNVQSLSPCPCREEEGREMPVEYPCVLLSVEVVEERWIVVMSPAVHAAHPMCCRCQRETLALLVDRRAVRHSTSRLQPNGHLGSAGVVSYDAVVE